MHTHTHTHTHIQSLCFCVLCRAAESAQERAETGRRAAEKRAATAENEVLQLRGALAQRDAEHTKVSAYDKSMRGTSIASQVNTRAFVPPVRHSMLWTREGTRVCLYSISARERLVTGYMTPSVFVLTRSM